MIAVEPVPVGALDAERYQRLVGARWKMRRNDGQGGKIVFGAVFVENPQTPGVHHNLQVNLYGGSRFFDDNECSNHWPPNEPRLIDSTLPTLSVGTVDYFHEYTPWVGVRSSDPRLFPRYTAWQDGNPKFPKIDTFAQFDIRGQDLEVEIRRGATFQGDREGWGMDCVAPLPAGEVFRIWRVRVRAAQRLFGWQIAVPEREGNRLRVPTPMNFLTEFFELPGLVQVYLWDLEFLDGGMQEWFPLPLWRVSYRIQEPPTIPTQGWGARVARYGSRRVLELSNDRSDSYSQQVGDRLDLASDPPPRPGPWLGFAGAESTVPATAQTHECTLLLSAPTTHDVAFRLRASGSAIAGVDFTDSFSTQTWVLLAGTDSIRVPVMRPGTSGAAARKTLVLTLDEVTGARVGETPSHRLQIEHPSWPRSAGGLSPPNLTRMAGLTCSLMALDWSPVEPPGDPWAVAGYRVFRDGTWVAFVRWPGRSCHDLVFPGSHRYELSTVASDGQESPRSPAETVWTPSCPPDAEGPRALLDPPLVKPSTQKVILQGTVVDDIGVSEAFLEINGHRSSRVAQVRLSPTNHLQVALSFEVPYAELDPATNQVRLVCSDASGKTARSDSVSFPLFIRPVPALTLGRNGPGPWTLSWPANAEGYVLQSTALGDEFGLWERVPGVAIPGDSRWTVEIDVSEPGRFFRLQSE